MSKVFICAAIPDELATREEGAVAVATAIEAGDERRARAKFHWQFLEHYPAAQDCAYKFWIGPYISIHFLSLNPLLACCRRYSRGER